MKSLYSLLFILGLCITATFAQIQHHFETAIIPSEWVGQRSYFTVSGGALQSNGPNLNSQQIFLSTPITIQDSLHWYFTIDLDFAPSSTNYLKTYLWANDSIFTNTSLSGYYLQIGETNQDTIKLYRQQGNTKTKLWSAPSVCFASATARYANTDIHVLRDKKGRWMIESACNGSKIFGSSGEVVDSTFEGNGFFGFACIYGTASRYNMYRFDDVMISSAPQVATTPSPVVTVPSAILPARGQIIINEIFADPAPSAGMPEYEYLELFNTSSSIFGLHQLILQDGTTDRVLNTNLSIPGGGYMVVCASAIAKIAIQEQFPTSTIVTLSGLSLTNTADHLVLKSSAGDTIDFVNYKDTWYPSDKKDGGWALERINPFKNCGSSTNWKVSVAADGGTPGFQNSVYDLQGFPKPVIQSVFVNEQTVTITFSDAAQLPKQKLYRGFTSQRLLGPNADTLILTLASAPQQGKIYSIRLDSLADCAGNLLKDTTVSFGMARPPAKGEVIMNEIMADENPVTGLPEAEFIELYNNSSDLIDLSGCRFSDNDKIFAVFPSGTLLAPGNYIIVCANTDYPLFKSYGNTVGLSNFPSLNNAGDDLRLMDNTGKLLDRVLYTDAWYGDAVKKEGGWSLEKVDPANPCSKSDNWTASEAVKGGTPGSQNSVYASNPDVAPPILIRAMALSADTIILIFNEVIDSMSAISSTYYIDGKTIKSIHPINEKAILTIDPPLLAGMVYTITSSNIKDCSGNMQETISASFTLPQAADSMDIIINEILFNPKPGGADFVEIYNRSPKTINLKGWSLANRSDSGLVANLKTITTEDLLLSPSAYLAVSVDIENIRNNYPSAINLLSMASMPAFNDDEGTVVLLNYQKKVIDQVFYSEDYHYKLIENKEGISLERISPFLPSNTADSWQSASSASGYATPGYTNSQIIALQKSEAEISIDPTVFTPDEDGWRDFTTIRYQFNTGGNTGNINIYNTEGRRVKRLVSNHLLGGHGLYQWDGLNDEGHKVQTGYYLILVEIFDLSGNTKTYKEKVVVGAKF